MVTELIEWVSGLATGLIEAFGYLGIFLGMAIESINIPLPSEVLMTFSGALVAKGEFSFWPVVLIGALGNVVGSVGNYYLAAYGGRPLFEKYGKYVLVHKRDLETADRWFAKYGLATVFFTRMLPVVRTFISFPAGLSRVRLVPFVLLTFAGSFIWSALLTYLGFYFGENYEARIRPIFKQFDLAIGAALVLLVVWYVARHLRLRRH
ncbi:MAG: DedA family protein [bacterium]|nr:DedA family protein [bacterium]MDZ4247946.1 DedA family protein [Patescibacteria group bacterium]